MSVKSITEAYNILEVHSSASQSEVKSAYKRLALRTHPDKNKGDPSANAKFQQVTEAFQMLMNVRYEPDDSGEEFSSEVFAEEFFGEDFGEDFANIIFRFVFSGSRRAAASFDTTKPLCNCIDCQFKRVFAGQKKDSDGRNPTSKNGGTNSNAAPPATSASREASTRATPLTRPSDPHADWLSEEEGEAKAAGPVKGKKSSRKKKNKKNSAKPVEEVAEGTPKEVDHEVHLPEAVPGDTGERRPDEVTLDRPDCDNGSSDSDISSVSTAGFHTPPAPAAGPQWKASPAPSRRVQMKKPRKGTDSSAGLPSISTAQNAQRAKKGRAAHTPTASYKSRTPRTPSSVASTHVGGYSAPGTPARMQMHQAHSLPTPTATSATAAKETPNDRASISPRKTTKTSPPKQGYTNPNLPNLEGVQLCRIFLLKHGKCRFGDKCKFSHGVAPGTVLAASGSEDGVFVSPRVSPDRTPSSEPSSSPREPPTMSVPVTITPNVQRGTGRTQVAVNPSIGGFGRKSAPRPPPSQRSRTTRKSSPSTDPPKSNGQAHKESQGSGQAQRPAHSAVPSKVKTNIYESAFGDSEESAGAGAGPVTTEKGMCAFYNTRGGCRNGQNCRFKHSWF